MGMSIHEDTRSNRNPDRIPSNWRTSPPWLNSPRSSDHNRTTDRYQCVRSLFDGQIEHWAPRSECLYLDNTLDRDIRRETSRDEFSGWSPTRKFDWPVLLSVLCLVPSWSRQDPRCRVISLDLEQGRPMCRKKSNTEDCVYERIPTRLGGWRAKLVDVDDPWRYRLEVDPELVRKDLLCPLCHSSRIPGFAHNRHTCKRP